MTLVPALLAGLLGSPHCAGMCGGLAAASGKWTWHAGRLTTYAILGAGAGTLREALPGPSWLPTAVAGLLLLPLALSVAGWLPAIHPPRKLVSWAGKAARGGHHYLFGLATGLLPCGLVYATLGLAVSAPGPLEGALTMLVFGAGTLPGLVLLSVAIRRLVARASSLRPALGVLVLIVGLGTLAIRSPSGSASGEEEPCPMHAGPAIENDFDDPSRAFASPPASSEEDHPVTVDAPRVGMDVEGGVVACSTCHSGLEPLGNPEGMHGSLVMDHGTLSCDSCHSEDRLGLHLADGTELELEEAMTLCTQCHGPQVRDYEGGSHGGMRGYWDLSQGPRERPHCLECHDAHDPSFQPLVPEPRAVDRVFVEGAH